MHTKLPLVPLAGRCRCEHVHFQLETAPIIRRCCHCCHCRLCQQATGSAFRTVAMIETDRLTVLEGTPRSFQIVKSHKLVQCPDCGCTLWVHRPELGDAIAFVGVAMLEHGERLPPEAHYFVRSKHPWIVLPPDVPAFAELGDPGRPGVGARIMAALAM